MGAVADFFRKTPEHRNESPSAPQPAPSFGRLDPLPKHYAAMRAQGHRAGLGDGLIESSASMARLTEFVHAATVAMRQPPFDPDNNADDKTLQDRADRLRVQLTAQTTALEGAQDLLRRVRLAMPTYRPSPPRPWLVIVLGIITFGVGLGLSFYPVFKFLGDPVLAWAAALASGIAVGGLVVAGLFR